MSIKPVARSIGDEVFNQIKEQIISGEWPIGSKIPTENELTILLQVSRISVRHAVQRLVGMGLLEIKRGDGTYVKNISVASQFENIFPMLMLSKNDFKEIYEFRVILEIENARLAAKRATEEDICKLRESYENMKDSQKDIEKFAQEDINFHTNVAMATHNSFIIKTTSIIHEVLQKMMLAGVKAVGMDAGIYYHEKIIEAIENKDSKNAAKIMKEHIYNSARTLLKSSEG